MFDDFVDLFNVKKYFYWKKDLPPDVLAEYTD